MLPNDFLNDRPLHFKNRYELWKKLTVNEEQITFVAESLQHAIVGFINGKNGRDEGMKNYAEVYCLYLLEKYHGQKIGFNLKKFFFDNQERTGFKEAYLWVLEHNPTMKKRGNRRSKDF